ncbi:MAG: hypothetical protein ACLRS1_11140 [Oscillospiraceae bacterium]
MENKISDYRTIDFLCFYLLGVTQADIDGSDKMPDHDLLFKCANRAYLDLNRTLKFQKVPEEDKGELQKQKSKFREEISEIIVDRITNLLNEKPQDYEAWHKETCNKVIKKAQEYEQDNWLQKNGNEGKGFYYGQAQKWVNMTIKYMWVTERWKDKLDKLMNVLHVPVDSYIIEGVWNRDGWEDVLKGILVNGKEKSGRFSSDKVVPWSKWDETQYKDFQVALRTKLKKEQTPFEWEEETWIEIAKLRANE